MKRVIILAIIALLSAVMFADGVQPAGTGTQANPWQVATLDNLLWVSTNSTCWADYFIQTEDIDAAATQTWNSGQGFSPIGTTTAFQGNYNGQNRIISNLYIYRPSAWNIGMFGNVNSGETYSISLVNCDVTGNYQAGGLVGVAYGSSIISDCNVQGIVHGNTNVGGLVGKLVGAEVFSCEVTGSFYGEEATGGLVGLCDNGAIIMNSSSTGNVSGYDSSGGIVGWLNSGSTVSSCLSNANVLATYNSGGIVGKSHNPSVDTCNFIDHCSNSGKVKSVENAGGLVGLSSTNLNITLSSNTGTVTGNCAGGLAGYCASPFLSCTTITNSYSLAEIKGYIGVAGLVGYLERSYINMCYCSGFITGEDVCGGMVAYATNNFSVLNSFWNTEISGQTTSAAGTGLTTIEMQDQDSFLDSGWDFVGESANGTDDIWNMCSVINNGFLYLSWQTDLPDTMRLDFPENDTTEHDFTTLDAMLQFTGNHATTGVTMGRFGYRPSIVGSLPSGLSNLADTYWSVHSSAGNVGTYSITFDVSNVDGIQSFLTLHLLKRNDMFSSWLDVEEDLGATLVFNYPYLTVEGLSSFSDFVIASGIDSTLPVELSSFTATQTSEDYARICWVTQSETDLCGYNLFRNTGDDLETAVRINPSIITPGNSSVEQTYTYTDTEVGVGATYCYWLESIELSGETDAFGPVTLHIVPASVPVLPTETALYAAYPNPFNPSTTIRFSVKENDEATLSIYNTRGQLVKTWEALVPGEHSVQWNGTDDTGRAVASGVYFYRLQSSTSTQVLKMLLIK